MYSSSSGESSGEEDGDSMGDDDSLLFINTFDTEDNDQCQIMDSRSLRMTSQQTTDQDLIAIPASKLRQGLTK